MANAKMIITLKKEKCIEDFIEMVALLNELNGMIPDWMIVESKPIADRISEIISEWVTVKDNKGR